MSLQSMLVLAPLLCAATLSGGCASECPSGGLTGSCDLATTMPDTALAVTRLQLDDTCDYVPPEACSGSPPYTCALGGGAQHNHAFAVLADRQGWEALAAHWDAACTAPEPPATWAKTFVVLVRGRASGASAASIDFSKRVRGGGTPVIATNLGLTFEDCDCAQQVTLGLVVSSETQPDVCVDVATTCQ